MSNLFEEALADAKKLKEVAEENAKKAILESVTPKIREFIEEQLLHEKETCAECGAMYEGDNHVCEDKKDDTDEGLGQDLDGDSEIGEGIDDLNEESVRELLKMIGGNEIYESLSSKEKKNVLNRSISKALSKFGNTDQQKLMNISNKINENLESLTNKRINNNVDNIQENNSMSNREKYYEIDLKMLREAVEEEAATLEMADMYEADDPKGEDEESKEEGYGLDELDDLNLDELDDDMLQELKVLLDFPNAGENDREYFADISAELEEGEEESDEEPSEDDESDEEPSEDDMEMDMELPDLDAPAGGKEEPMNEVFDVDPRMLRQELNKIRRQLREGKVDHHFGGKGGSKAGVKGAFGGNGPKKAGYQKSFGGGAYGKDPFVNPPQINKLNEAIRKLRRMNRSQSEKLNKYRGAVQTLREQLEDLNLFNAKLLYVNKLLQNKTLSESQKKSVIKALDEAKSLNETKALYKSLTESFKSTKGTLNESTRFGSSSRVTTSASGKKAIGELDRWQTLAGLKK